MASLESLQPLHGQAVSLAEGRLREATAVGKLIIRCDISSAPVAELLVQHGLSLPTVANTYTGTEKGELFWLGPDEWLLRSNADPNSSEWSDTVNRLGKAASDRPDVHIALVDVSDYYTVLQLEGPHASAILARSCPLDLRTLHPSEVKRCAQTRMGNASVMLNTHTLSPAAGEPLWNLQVRWSYADYLWKLLLRSAISF